MSKNVTVVGTDKVNITFLEKGEFSLRPGEGIPVVSTGNAKDQTAVVRGTMGKEGFSNFLADLGERAEGTTLGRFGERGQLRARKLQMDDLSRASIELAARPQPRRRSHRSCTNCSLGSERRKEKYGAQRSR